jgi:NADPH:quinone reductase-like Zn-dependent oxidoreductase
MLAVHLTQFGEPERSLKVVDVPEPPAPAAGQALIQVEYAPLDHHDLLLAKGVYPVRPELPSVIGNEGAGTVLAVGPGVTGIRPGDTVHRRGQVHQPRTSGDAHHQPHHRPAGGVA